MENKKKEMSKTNFVKLRKDLADDYHIEFVGTTNDHWLVCVEGPAGSVFAGLSTWWQLVFPPTFPTIAPAVFSQTDAGKEMPHPNLLSDTTGRRRLCNAELREWSRGSPADVLRIIENALADPDWGTNSPSSMLTKENFGAAATRWGQFQK